MHKLNLLCYIPSSAVLLIADVDNLYPSIPINEDYNVVAEVLNRSVTQTSPLFVYKELVLELLKVQLEHNCFEFNGVAYKQTKGVPMGKAWAPAVASLFMANWDANFLERLTNKPRMFCRYIDDILLIFDNEFDAHLALLAMNAVHPNIHVSEYSIAQTGHFLDVNLAVVNNSTLNWSIMPFPAQLVCEKSKQSHSVRIQLYRKSTDLVVLMHFGSLNNWSQKLNVVFAQLVRIVRLTNDPQSAGYNMRILLNMMTALRGLPARCRRNLLLRALHFAAKEFVCTLISHVHGLQSERNSSCIRYHSNLQLPVEVDAYQFVVALKRATQMLSARQRDVIGNLSVQYETGLSLQRILFAS